MRVLEADVEEWVEEKLLSEKAWDHLHIELSRSSVPVCLRPQSFSGFENTLPIMPHMEQLCAAAFSLAEQFEVILATHGVIPP